MPCGGGCGGNRTPIVRRENAIKWQQVANLPEPANDETLYLIYNDIPDTVNIKGPITSLQYRWGKTPRLRRKIVVDKDIDWIDTNTEVHLLDAKVFITMRKRTGPAFIHDLVVNLPKEVPTTPQVPPMSKAEEVASMLEVKPLEAPPKTVTDFSVKTIKDIIERGTLTLNEANDWLETERASETPRVTAIRELEAYIDNLSNNQDNGNPD